MAGPLFPADTPSSVGFARITRGEVADKANVVPAVAAMPCRRSDFELPSADIGSAFFLVPA